MTFASTSKMFAMEAIDYPHCSSYRGRELVFDTSCIKTNKSIIIKTKPKNIDLDISEHFLSSCNDVIDDFSLFRLKKSSLEVSNHNSSYLKVNMIIFNETLIDASALHPVSCYLFSDGVDSGRKRLSDEMGCPIDKMTEFRVSSKGFNRLFQAFLDVSTVLDNMTTLQCSLVPCGVDCMRLCPRSNIRHFAHQLLVSHKIDQQLVSSHCSHLNDDSNKYKLVLIFLSCLICLSVVCLFLTVADGWMDLGHQLLQMLKHVVRPPRDKAPIRVQIVHPLDKFSSPPEMTSESVAHLKELMNNVLSLKRKTTTKTISSRPPSPSGSAEHLKVSELIPDMTSSTSNYQIIPSLMDTLPDPPTISVQEIMKSFDKPLKAFESRKSPPETPTPMPRTSSVSDIRIKPPASPIYSNPPPPPSTSPPSSLRDHHPSTVIRPSILDDNQSQNIDFSWSEMEFNTLDRPMGNSVIRQLKRDIRNDFRTTTTIGSLSREVPF